MPACEQIKTVRNQMRERLEEEIGVATTHKIWDIGRIMQEFNRCGFNVNIIITDDGLEQGQLTFKDDTNAGKD